MICRSGHRIGAIKNCGDTDTLTRGATSRRRVPATAEAPAAATDVAYRLAQTSVQAEHAGTRGGVGDVADDGAFLSWVRALAAAGH